MSEGSDSKNSQVIAPSLDTKKHAFSHPTYRLLRKTPTDSAPINIAPTSDNETTFELPMGQVFNLSESYINLQYNIPAEANYRHYLHNDTYAMISQIDIHDEQGVHLCELKHVNNYIKVVGKKEMSFQEFMTRDSSCEIIHPNHVNNANSHAFRPTAWNSDIPDDFHRYTGLSYLESNYFRVGEINTALSGTLRIPLSDFKNTIMAQDMNIFLPRKFMFVIKWAPGNKAVWSNTSATAKPNDVSNKEVAVEIALRNLEMYIAVETNPKVIKKLVDRVTNADIIAKKGPYQIYIPYVSAKKMNGDSVSQTINFNATSAQGQRIQKIIHSAFSRSESKNTAYDCNNYDGVKIKKYQTSINGNPRRDFEVRCERKWSDDYMLNKRYLRGSAIQTSNIYQYNWFHCDDFTELPAPGDTQLPVKNTTLRAGIEMDPKVDVYMGGVCTWEGTMTCSDDPNLQKLFHYIWVVGQKVLTLHGSDVAVN